jgi:hypothetical protein
MFTKELDSLDLRCYTTVGMDQFPMLYGGSNLDFTGDHLELPGDHSLSPIHVSASRKKKIILAAERVARDEIAMWEKDQETVLTYFGAEVNQGEATAPFRYFGAAIRPVMSQCRKEGAYLVTIGTDIGAGRIVEVPLFGRSSRTKRLYVNHSVGSLQFLTFSGAIGNGQSVLDQRGLETRMAFSGKITETMYSYF